MRKGKAGKAVKITLITIAAVIVLLLGGGFLYYFSILNGPQPPLDGHDYYGRSKKEYDHDHGRSSRHDDHEHGRSSRHESRSSGQRL